MSCYHTTTLDKLESILAGGLRPNSPPTWFSAPAPYVMLSDEPWWDLNGSESVVIEVQDPRIKPDYFDDPEGLRWPYHIKPMHLRVLKKKKKKKDTTEL